MRADAAPRPEANRVGSSEGGQGMAAALSSLAQAGPKERSRPLLACVATRTGAR